MTPKEFLTPRLNKLAAKQRPIGKSEITPLLEKAIAAGVDFGNEYDLQKRQIRNVIGDFTKSLRVSFGTHTAHAYIPAVLTRTKKGGWNQGIMFNHIHYATASKAHLGLYEEFLRWKAGSGLAEADIWRDYIATLP